MSRRKYCIITDIKLRELVWRYDGIGPPLTPDEVQILLSALYMESEGSGGIVAQVYPETAKREVEP